MFIDPICQDDFLLSSTFDVIAKDLPSKSTRHPTMYVSADAGEKEMKDNFARISYHQIVCSVKHANGSICLFKLFRHCGYIY